MFLRSLALCGVLLAAAPAGAIEGGIKIGVLNDQTGLFADLAGYGSVVAAQIAAEEIGGKVRGQPIEIVVADHLNKPDVGAAITRRWFDTENVDVVTDVPSSSVALAVQEIARAHKKIFLMSSTASSDFSGKACSPYGFQWTFDTYAMAKGAAALVGPDTDTWFFLTTDYAFGHALERDATKFVQAAGGKVLGAVRHPLNSADFSSFLLQAQASKAKVIGLVNSGGDVSNSIKQAVEFGIPQQQRLAALSFFETDVHSVGLQAAQGLTMTGSFYWGLNDETRAWSKKFMARNNGRAPTMIQAGVYSAVRHYLKAVDATDTKDGDIVSAKMRETPIDDFYTKKGKVRVDGRVIRDFYVLQVKSPAESKYPWDYFKVLSTIPGEEMARPLAESECPMVKQQAEKR
jgi:branched-chain amino acid transport system substrate-binding protein